MKLEIKYRENMHGRSCVAPFINGWNVWDIPEQEWTYAVQRAVLRAYELGWKHCLKDINEKMNPPDTPQNWNDAALRGEGD